MGDRYTVVGGRGFIGGAVSALLRAAGHDVTIAAHRDPIPAASLGHVIYASGIAGTAASDATYAFESQVNGVQRLLAGATFDSLLLLSSTRVYGAASDTVEGAPLAVTPETGGDVYRITKIAGEALCLAHPSPYVRVARLSNVIGPSFESSLFVSDVLRQAAREGRVGVRTTRDSAKDYIGIDDACRYLISIAQHGRSRLYNVAAGENVENGAIYDALSARGIAVEIAPGAARAVTPPVHVKRLHAEFGTARDSFVTELPALLDTFVAHFRTEAAR